jgi:alpha-1,6-mannosyltransferase
VKTLHLTNAYHPTSGGIRNFYDALLRAAPSSGRELRLVVPASETRVQKVNGHARIYHVRAPRSAFFDSRYRVILPFGALARDGPIVRILRDEQPDLLEVCDKYSLCYLAGILRKGWISGVRRPVLVGLSCERMDDNVQSYLGLGRLGRALASLYMRRVYLPQFDHHLANSAYTANELERQTPKHRRAVQILPMGVELDRFGPSRRTEAARHELLERIGGSPTTRVLVYAGRLASEKNLGLLPSTLEQLGSGGVEYRLVIAGDGPRARWLADEFVRRGATGVRFWRHLDREAIAELLANADVFVHPNPREPFGIAPLEAMASGLPLVAPNAGGVATYATEEASWPAPPNPASFAERIREVFADPLTRRRKVARALAVAADYRWEVVAQQFFATYEQLIRGAAGTPYP